MESQELSSQDQDGLSGSVMESLGEPKEVVEEMNESRQGEGKADQEDLPEGVKDRIWRQERKHQREMRNMKAQLENLQSHLSSRPNMESSNDQAANSYMPQSDVDEQIHKAVGYALRHKEEQESKVKEAERMQHVHKQYQGLHKHLDDVSDKYDDFEEVVRGQDAPFTPHMRDAALLLPRKGAGSAGEVLYKLGKNPSELDRISRLQPVDQASEVIRLSHALIGGEDSKSPQSRPLGQIKSNPSINSHAITDRTPVSELRKRMKANWK